MDYDLAGNIAWTVTGSTLTSLACDRTSVPMANKTLRQYDTRNRPLLVDVPNSTDDIAYTYFNDGALKTLASGSNIWTYAYNKRRLPMTEQLSIDSRIETITHAYDTLGHESTLTYPDGLVIATAPNALGQPTKAGPYASGINYFPNGGMSGFTYHNGIVHSVTQNARQLPLRSLDMNGATAVLDDTYSYDANGNVAGIADGTTSSPNTRSMTYDNLDRLSTTSAQHQWWINATTTYDDLDNIRTNVVGNRTNTFAYDPTTWRLSGISGSATYTLGYDIFGNVISKGTGADSYLFDAANRMQSVTGKESYQYDGYGRRVKISSMFPVPGKTDYPVYTMSGQLLTDDDQRSNKTTDYISLNGSLVAKRAATIGTTNWVTTYEHTDALHSPVVETNSSGMVNRIELYTPYGEPGDGSYTQGPGFTGHVTDAATGLTYAQQRYYDPILGRFLSVDPVQASDTGSSFNRYRYANNNPYRFSDPDGRCAASVGTNICGVQAVGTETAAGSAVTKVLQSADGNSSADTSKPNVNTGNRALAGAQSKIAGSHNAGATSAWNSTSWRYDPTNPELTNPISNANGSKGFAGAFHDPADGSIIHVGDHMFDFAQQVQRSYFNASFTGGSSALVFVFLHELGHVWDQRTNPGYNGELRKEREMGANTFAAGFFTKFQQSSFDLTLDPTCANCQP